MFLSLQIRITGRGTAIVAAKQKKEAMKIRKEANPEKTRKRRGPEHTGHTSLMLPKTPSPTALVPSIGHSVG